MKEMASKMKQNFSFLFAAIVVLLVMFVLLVTYSKAEGFVLLNFKHHYILTRVFDVVTFLGDGIFLFLVMLFIVLFKRQQVRIAGLIFGSYILSGFFSQILKNIIVAPRPIVYFNQIKSSFFIDTFHYCRVGFSSFPSGHTATVFAFATVCSFCFSSKRLKMFFLFMAFLVGYSRIYLGNHFLLDVFGGAVLGLFSGVLVVAYQDKIFMNLKSRLQAYNSAFIDSSTIT